MFDFYFEGNGEPTDGFEAVNCQNQNYFQTQRTDTERQFVGRPVNRQRGDGGLNFVSNSDDGESWIGSKDIQDIESIELELGDGIYGTRG